MATETILNMEGARIKFGAGATRELGFEMRALGGAARVPWLPIR